MAPKKKYVKEEETASSSMSKKQKGLIPIKSYTSKGKSVSSQDASPDTVKPAAFLRIGRNMPPKVVVGKFLDFLEAVKIKEERDDDYNKLKLQEVTATLDIMSKPTVMKAVPEFVLSEDAPNMLNMLLDGLGESTKHGNKMVFAVMKSALNELRNNERVSKAHALRIVKVLDIHSQFQLNSKQCEVTTELTRLLMHHKWK